MSTAEITVPAAVSSVPTARRFVESILSAWGQREMAWSATLIASELASNAALHARGTQFTIRLHVAGERIRLEVSDSSLRLPQQRTYSDEAATGRGLHLVDALAMDWGVTPSATGKTIWVVLPAADRGDTHSHPDADALSPGDADPAVRLSDGQPEGPLAWLAAAA